MKSACAQQVQSLSSGKEPLPEPCAACALRVLSVCDAIDDCDLDRLAAITSVQDIARHQIFVTEGDPADHLFNVTDGTVKVYKLLPDGRQQITGFLFAGDFLGLSFLERYGCSAEAVTRVRCCRFPRKQFAAMLTDFPGIERRLLGIASNELAAAQDHMVLLGRKTARERVSTFLLMLSRRAARSGGTADPVILPMTRTDIADYLGLTVETVSRTFTQLKKDGFIELREAGVVHLSNLPALEDLNEGF